MLVIRLDEKCKGDRKNINITINESLRETNKQAAYLDSAVLILQKRRKLLNNTHDPDFEKLLSDAKRAKKEFENGRKAYIWKLFGAQEERRKAEAAATNFLTDCAATERAYEVRKYLASTNGTTVPRCLRPRLYTSEEKVSIQKELDEKAARAKAEMTRMNEEWNTYQISFRA